jgi:hypothetical protein
MSLGFRMRICSFSLPNSGFTLGTLSRDVAYWSQTVEYPIFIFLFLRVASSCVNYCNLFGVRQSQLYFSNIFYYIIYPLHVSATTGHPQVEYIYWILTG